MIGRRFAIVENCLGGLVRRWHYLKRKQVRKGRGGQTRRVSYVDVGPVDRKRAFLLSNNHRHLSVHGIFLHTKDKLSERPFQKGTYILTLYAAVKSCDALKSKSGASDMRLNIDAAIVAGREPAA